MQKAWKVSPRRFPEGWPSPSCNSFVDTPSPELIHTPIATLTQNPALDPTKAPPPDPIPGSDSATVGHSYSNPDANT